jgi:hypothetical protein
LFSDEITRLIDGFDGQVDEMVLGWLVMSKVERRGKEARGEVVVLRKRCKRG